MQYNWEFEIKNSLGCNKNNTEFLHETLDGAFQ